MKMTNCTALARSPDFAQKTRAFFGVLFRPKNNKISVRQTALHGTPSAVTEKDLRRVQHTTKLPRGTPNRPPATNAARQAFSQSIVAVVERLHGGLYREPVAKRFFRVRGTG